MSNLGGTPPPASTISPAAVAVDTHNTRTDVFNVAGARILCVADIRGAISSLNALAAEHNASAIIHTGDFGYFETSSLASMSDRTLRHLIQYSSLLSPAFRSQLLAPTVTGQQMRNLLSNPSTRGSIDTQATGQFFGLSEFPKLLSGELKLDVPVYSIWGACEDVAVLEKIRLAGPSILSTTSGAPSTPATAANPTRLFANYAIPNLTVLDEATTRLLTIGGVKLRLFGLGGAVVSHKFFDNGSGTATIAGGNGTMWTTVLQIGELVDTAQKVFDPTETRLLISHASPGREGILSQLCLALKVDLTVSGGLHFRYGSSYNEFSVQHDPEAFRIKLEAAAKGFNEVWDTVKSQVESAVDENQRRLLQNALEVVKSVPAPSPVGNPSPDEITWKNTWNWNLPDASHGSLVLDVRDGRVGCEMKSQGFNFAYRQNVPKPASTATVSPEVPTLLPTPSSLPATAASLPIPSPSPASHLSNQQQGQTSRFPAQRQPLPPSNSQPINPLQHRAFPSASASPNPSPSGLPASTATPHSFQQQNQQRESIQRGSINAILNHNKLPSGTPTGPAALREASTVPSGANRLSQAAGQAQGRSRTWGSNGLNGVPNGESTVNTTATAASSSDDKPSLSNNPRRSNNNASRAPSGVNLVVPMPSSDTSTPPIDPSATPAITTTNGIGGRTTPSARERAPRPPRSTSNSHHAVRSDSPTSSPTTTVDAPTGPPDENVSSDTAGAEGAEGESSVIVPTSFRGGRGGRGRGSRGGPRGGMTRGVGGELTPGGFVPRGRGRGRGKSSAAGEGAGVSVVGGEGGASSASAPTVGAGAPRSVERTW